MINRELWSLQRRMLLTGFAALGASALIGGKRAMFLSEGQLRFLWARRASMVRWVVPLISCAVLVGAAGLVKVITQASGPVFIAQVRNKLQSEGWTDVRTMQEGQYIQATGMRDGQAQKVIVDSRTGRLRSQMDDDDDD
jgi:hypothetical protein